jgi:hypothetical protein
MDGGGFPSTRIWYIEVMGHWDPISYKLVLFLFYCLFCLLFFFSFEFAIVFQLFFSCVVFMFIGIIKLINI